MAYSPDHSNVAPSGSRESLLTMPNLSNVTEGKDSASKRFAHEIHSNKPLLAALRQTVTLTLHDTICETTTILVQTNDTGDTIRLTTNRDREKIPISTALLTTPITSPKPKPPAPPKKPPRPLTPLALLHPSTPNPPSKP